MVRPIPNTALTIWAGLELGCSEQIRYAEAVDLRSTDPTDDVWNFEQLQREKAMLTEEVARLAPTERGHSSFAVSSLRLRGLRFDSGIELLGSRVVVVKNTNLPQ